MCRSTAAERGCPPSTIGRYDDFFSVFSRYAFKCMLLSGAYESMDEIQQWCNKLTTGIASRAQHYDVDPFRIFDAAVILKKRHGSRRLVQGLSTYLRDFFGLFCEQRVTW